MIRTEGVLHFTIPVKDLDRSEKFYTEILGMEKIRRTGHMVFTRVPARIISSSPFPRSRSIWIRRASMKFTAPSA